MSKSYVSELIRANLYEIQVERKRIKNRKPGKLPKNLVWGMDLTGKTDINGNLTMIAGIVEHSSRACFTLEALKDKSSIALLQLLLDCCKSYGIPRFLRTDN